MDYHNKYLKYKKKYLDLKKLIGGFTYDISNEKDIQQATLAARENGISANEINSTIDAIKNADMNTVNAILKNFNNKHENMPPEIPTNIIEYLFSKKGDNNLNLPDHLPDD